MNPIIKSPRIVTLFSDQPASNWRPSSILFSILLHGVGFALLIFLLSHMPHTVVPPTADRYTVRLMNLEKPEPVPVRRRSGGAMASPAPGSGTGSAQSKGSAQGRENAQSGGSARSGQAAPSSASVQSAASAQPAAQTAAPEPGAAAPPIALQAARLEPLHRTLVQPDVPPNLPRLKENPLPRILMWSADTSSQRKIMPPPPREVTAWSNVRPVLTPPNHETRLADIRIAASTFATAKLPTLPPSNTAPVAASRPQTTPQIPQTASKSTAIPTPARVISLSDLQVQTGTVAMPLVNEIAPASVSSLTTGLPNSTATEGKGSAVGSQNGSGASQNAGGNGKQVASAAGNPGRGGTGAGSANAGGSGTGGPGTGSGTGAAGGKSGNGTGGTGTAGTGTAGGAGKGGNNASGGNGTGNNGTGGNGTGGNGTGGKGLGGNGTGGNGSGGNGTGGDGSGLGGGAGPGNDLAFDRVNLPKDGQFGVVVAGSQSLAEQYPEVAGVWIGRLAYTVYLHVGLQKSWILQYSLPRDAEASVVGNAVRPDAPWPYTIVRPHLAPGDLNADAVLVHGFVNSSGHFEQLKVVFPEEFTQTRFVLASLEQWQFRPARQNGRIAPVEVLLIIPDQPE